MVLTAKESWSLLIIDKSLERAASRNVTRAGVAEVVTDESNVEGLDSDDS